mgnify:FL=1
MDNKEFNLRKDWDSIETVASDIWPEEWSQLNPLEIKALEEIIEKKKSLNLWTYLVVWAAIFPWTWRMYITSLPFYGI